MSEAPAPPPATSTESAAASVVVPPAPKTIRGGPRGDKELPTTSGQIAWENLEGQITDLARLLGKSPGDMSLLRMLASQKYVHARVRGDLDEIEESIKLTTRCLEMDKTPEAYLVRASRQQALHRLKEASADLVEAKKLGANPETLADVQAELDWIRGNYEPALAHFRAQRAKSPSHGTWLREGIVDLELGNYEAADRAFEEAEDLVRDTSPFPVVHLDVTRGIQKQKQGQLEAGVAFFREAVRRLPQHVGATEHLAETLHWLGQDDEATKIYESLTKTTSDPEFVGALAAIYRAKGRAKEADALRAKATMRYGELIKKYPEAMYWHAAEFFLGEGKDPKRALELLKKNVELRPNGTSYTALAKAHLANGQVKEAKGAIDTSLSAPIDEANKHWVAAAIYKKLGDDARSRELADHARKMNPVIEKIEGPL
jgi:tetratricopeptide (TPR) repeat protein